MGFIQKAFLGLYLMAGIAMPERLFSQAWTPPVDVSMNPLMVDAEFPQIAADPSGRFVSVWIRNDGASSYIESSTSTDGVTWSVPFPLSLQGDPTLLAFNPQISVDPSGRFAAVWERDNGAGFFVIQASTSTDGTTWSMPADLSSAINQGSLAQIAADGSGRFVTTWALFTGGVTVIQASTSTDGSVWVPANTNLSQGGQFAFGNQVAAEPSGRFVAVWNRSDGLNARIQASTSVNGTDWLPLMMPINLSLAGQNTDNPQIIADDSGRFVAVWRRTDAGSRTIQASTSTDGINWSLIPADLYAPSALAVSPPQISVDSTGLFVAIWSINSGGIDIVQTSTSTDGAAWSAPVSISNLGADAVTPYIQGDSLGNFMAIWKGDVGGNFVIQSSTSDNGTTWTAPILISDPVSDASDPVVAADGSGHYVAIWEFIDSLRNIIQGSSASLAALDPPSSAIGQRILNRFLTQSEYVNRLRWTSSPSQDVASYRIYRNGTLIASVPSSTLSYNDPRGKNITPDTYEITAVNTSGDESLPISFAVD